MTGPQEQPLPPDTIGRDDAVEVLRAFVVGNGLSISFMRAFDDPAMWGMLLVDVARHAARVFAKEGVMSEAEALEAIRSMFEMELASPTDLGNTAERKQH
jgi:hypothetical protein